MIIYGSLDFKNFADDRLASFAFNVYNHLLEDKKYDSLKALIDDLKVKKDAFNLDSSNALLGGKPQTANKNASKVNLNALLHKILRRLEDMAADNGNNPRYITDAAFELRATKSKSTKDVITELDTPILTVQNVDTKAGVAKGTWNAIAKAINYALQYRIKDAAIWVTGFHNDIPEYTFTGLESGKVYEFQVCAQGPGGVSSGWATSLPVYVS